jgi:tryptophanyl-tRNA synthetase
MRFLSGIQPSHQVTLGNYLGAIRSWVQHQEGNDCFFMLADLHTLTVPQPRGKIRGDTLLMLATLQACGLRPEKSVLFAQSSVPEHAEFSWILQCMASTGEFERMTQFKDKSQKQQQGIRVGLFTYPALMAADILLYQAKRVPVGLDQKQHLEITRDLASRLNQWCQADVVTLPEGWTPGVGAKIMSLQEPERKMSKSDPDQSATLFLTDTADVIKKKLQRAKTDSGSEVKEANHSPGILNLITIQAALAGVSVQERIDAVVGLQYGKLKLETVDMVTSFIDPIRTQTLALLKEESALLQTLSLGAELAQAVASETLRQVYATLGLIGKSLIRLNTR